MDTSYSTSRGKAIVWVQGMAGEIQWMAVFGSMN